MVMFFPVGVNFKKPGGGGGGNDPYANNVVLLLTGQGVNGSTNIIDSSPAPKVISNDGANTAIISSDQSKYGTSSILFNSSRLSTESNLDLILGTGDFTAESWVFRTDGSGYQAVIILGDGSDTGLYIFNSSILYYDSGTVVSGGEIINNQWNHLAVTRISGAITIFLNGILLGSGDRENGYSAQNYTIGRNRNNSEPFTGYMERVRVTKGLARYTANFNPETDTYL